jgi:hypothetical protein
MLVKSPHYTTAPAMTQKRVITGQWIGKAKLAKCQLAELAAMWLAEEIEVKPTAAMAAVLFRVSTPYITQATANLRKAKAAAKKQNGDGNGHNGNGNGNGGNGGNDYVVVRDQLPFTPDAHDLWSHMDDEERDEFILEHLDSMWAAFERVT